MNLSDIWGQFLLNASTLCIRSNIEFAQDVTQVIQINGSSSRESENEGEIEENSDEEEEDVNETVDSNGNVFDSNSAKKKSIQRTRYSREEYKCILCPYSCTTEKAYLRHLRQCESKEDDSIPLISCPVCGKDRPNEMALSIHMVKHKLGKQFCCDLCKFKSVQLKKIIQHRRMHTGEKPHLCPYCKYRSSRRDNLRSHVRRVHKKDNLICDTFTPRSMLVTPTKRI